MVQTMRFGAVSAWLVCGLFAVVMVGGCVGPGAVMAADGNCPGGQCKVSPIGVMAKNIAENQVKKVEGWANVPGGTVWLEPGRQAYEHDTGLVRDLRTGQKSYPVTPQSVPQYSPQPIYQPLAVRSPVVGPVSPVPVAPCCPNPYYVPAYQPYSRNAIDVGPYGYGGVNYGAIHTRGATIGQTWRRVQ